MHVSHLGRDHPFSTNSVTPCIMIAHSICWMLQPVHICTIDTKPLKEEASTEVHGIGHCKTIPNLLSPYPRVPAS